MGLILVRSQRGLTMIYFAGCLLVRNGGAIRLLVLNLWGDALRIGIGGCSCIAASCVAPTVMS
jgi:hypothetical protein